ncbi:Twinfilin-1 [Blyttiomyces sp. JEL0837]|nr:Twinfilin-1 [Blyttiomyces sp. JEL0837]
MCVREKMLYASSRATLTKELGDMKFADFLHATKKDEVTLEGYRLHLIHKEAEAPLTEKEKEYQKVKMTETGADIGASTRKTLAASGIGLPFTSSAQAALESFKGKEVNVVVLVVDIEQEQIDLHKADTVDLNGLQSIVPEGMPCYICFAYNHTFEGQPEEPVLFFYICPQGVKVKARMMFSSSKNAVVQFIEEAAGIPLLKKIELESTAEIDKPFLTDYLHPVAAGTPPAQSKASFARPTKPGRGPQRITKVGE